MKSSNAFRSTCKWVYFIKNLNTWFVVKGILARFYPIKHQCCPHIEISQLICYANQLTGFYMRATLAFNGLISHSIIFSDIKHKNIILTMWKRKVKKLQLQTSLGNRKNRCREKENLLVREAYFRIAWPKRGELLLNVFVNWSNKSKKKNSNLKLNRVSCNYLLCSLVRYVT